MAKPPVTLQQRLGFLDADLCKPTHDQIMIWLGKVAPVMLPVWLGGTIHWQEGVVEQHRKKAEKRVVECTNQIKEAIGQIESSKNERRNRKSPLTRELLKYSEHSDDARVAKLSFALQDIGTIDLNPPLVPPVPEIEGAPVWEHPLNNAGQGRKPNIIGFADMLIHYRRPRLELDLGDLSTQGFTDWLQYGGRLQGPSYVQWRSAKAFFEVKTEIPSLGELMRQLQLYRQHLLGDWFVVSPDTRFRDTLAEQGIGFVEYKPTKEELQ